MNKFFKRIFDIAFALTCIFLLIPVFLSLFLLVLKDLGFPILFIQERAGKGGRPFKILKFRTMRGLPGSIDILKTPDERLTRIGKAIRATRLDEIPQFFNVLAGDMSIVGPRPLLLKYNDLYSSHQALRLTVRPGITGWAQIKGANAISWEEKFELDVWYVRKQSVFLDAYIILKTVPAVLTRSGVNSNDGNIVKEFTGNE